MAVECESISLSRGVPFAILFWVKPIIKSVPREYLESALLPLRKALTRSPAQAGKAPALSEK